MHTQVCTNLFIQHESHVCAFHSMLMSKLANFIEANYKETSAERELRLRHLREQAEAQRRYRCINHLFDVWDNNKSGYLELDELQMVVKTWKDFTDEQALLHGMLIICTYIRTYTFVCTYSIYVCMRIQ